MSPLFKREGRGGTRPYHISSQLASIHDDREQISLLMVPSSFRVFGVFRGLLYLAKMAALDLT